MQHAYYSARHTHLPHGAARLHLGACLLLSQPPPPPPRAFTPLQALSYIYDSPACLGPGA